MYIIQNEFVNNNKSFNGNIYYYTSWNSYLIQIQLKCFKTIFIKGFTVLKTVTSFRI